MPPPPTHYVRKTGSDSNSGTSPSSAWLTLNYAINALGDTGTLYVGAGVYRETVTMTAGAGPFTGARTIIADVEGQYTGDPGEVRLTAYTTDDKTAPATKTLVLSGQSYLTFSRFVFVGGSAACVDGWTTPGSGHITFTNCTFFSGTGAAADDCLIRVTNLADPNNILNWTVSYCVFVMTYGAAIFVDSLVSASADYDMQFAITNSLFVGGSAGGASPHPVIYCTCAGLSSGSGLPGGLTATNCTNMVGGTPFLSTDSNFSSSTHPCVVTRLLSVGGGLNAAVSGQITEDYNVLIAPTTRVNVSAGAHSQTGTTYSPLMHVGQSLQQKKFVQPFATPTFDSPLLGFAPKVPDADFLGIARPSGAGVAAGSTNSSVGYLELHDYGQKGTAHTAVGSTTSLLQVGRGDLNFRLPVTPVSTTIAVRLYRDFAPVGPTTCSVLANGEIGVAAQAVSDAGSDATWNTITMAPFTPTARGWVGLRLYSSGDSSGAGNLYWDNLTVNVPPTSPPASPLSAVPSAYYRFENNDLSSPGNNLSLGLTHTVYGTGKISTGLIAGSSLAIGSGALFPDLLDPSLNWSVSFWAWTASTTPDGDGPIIVVGDTYFLADNFYLQALNVGGTGQMSILDNDGPQIASAAFTRDAWHHFVFSNSSTTLKAYIDGTLAATATGRNGFKNTFVHVATDCKMDELSYYKAALTAADVTALYAGGNGFDPT
jgi:hypothetical protein